MVIHLIGQNAFVVITLFAEVQSAESKAYSFTFSSCKNALRNL